MASWRSTFSSSPYSLIKRRRSAVLKLKRSCSGFTASPARLLKLGVEVRLPISVSRRSILSVMADISFSLTGAAPASSRASFTSLTALSMNRSLSVFRRSWMMSKLLDAPSFKSSARSSSVLLYSRFRASSSSVLKAPNKLACRFFSPCRPTPLGFCVSVSSF